MRLFLHSRDMKRQHVKFGILRNRLGLLHCNLIQINFALTICLIGQFFDDNFYPFSGVSDDVPRSLNVSQRQASGSMVT